jgi:hypothetical protein
MLEKWDINITVLHCNEEVDVHEVEGEVEKYKKRKERKIQLAMGVHTSSSGSVIDSSMRERISFSTRLR